MAIIAFALQIQCGLHSFCWGVFTNMGHMLDNLEVPHDNVVEKVAPASQPILASLMIEGINNVSAIVYHYCSVPPTHA